ncbi:CHAD domain-containing protein [Streptomyces sp. NPDC020141]|uniref:CHAD domain-containing protein n=1 Tax=Streptomyces sp. NPDC020141 TaxID=3365065 RepID=UPI0037A40241
MTPGGEGVLNPELSRVPAQAGAPAPAASPAGDALAGYLHARAGEFLRGLRLHGESGVDTAGAAEAARALRTASRRIGGTLHTFRPLLEPVWADGLRAELAWLATTLAQEHACVSRLNRLLAALGRLSGAPGPGTAGPGDAVAGSGALAGSEAFTGSGASAKSSGGSGALTRSAAPAGTAAAPRARRPGPSPAAEGSALTVGAARAGALLERQLTLGRTRAHSAALQALGSARFHAVADSVALLASELPPAPRTRPGAPAPAHPPAAETTGRLLLESVAALPLARAGLPYNAEALVHGLTASAEEAQDAPWHRVRRLLRLHRYALEVLGPEPDPVLARAGRLLDRHRDAAEAAAAAAAAARTPRIAPATAYALGVLHADQRHEVEAVRFAFQETWRETSSVRTGAGR